jgi:hypothetical protein
LVLVLLHCLHSNTCLHYLISLIFSAFILFLLSLKTQLTELGQSRCMTLDGFARESSVEKDKLEIGSCQGPDWWLTQPWQGRGNYLKLLLYFCFHLVVSLWWLSETETGNVWIGSNGREEWSHRNEWHGRNTNVLSSFHQLSACRKQIRQNCLHSAWFKPCDAVRMTSPSYWAVTQRRTVVCFRRFGTSYWSYFIRSGNPRRMPDIVWSIHGILLGSFELRRRDQQDVPKRRHQTTLQHCITSQKSGYFCSYTLSYCFVSVTVARCWWRFSSCVSST